MQEVRVYYSMLQAERDMKSFIEQGWRVHTCTMSCYVTGCNSNERVLVVYEK